MHLVGFVIRIYHDGRSPERYFAPRSYTRVEDLEVAG